MSGAHPDVFDEIDPGSLTHSWPGFATENPDHMLLALEYVEEFVAQSDVYPIDHDNS